MRSSRVKQRWSQNKLVFCTLVALNDPAVCEMASNLGVDCVWIDLEHHATSVENLGHMVARARINGTDIMARPAKGEFMRMGRLLEAGAHGILYPRCESPEEAREVVRWAKFAPLGERGFDGGNPDNDFGAAPVADYVRAANEQTWIAVQIESPNAAEQAERIAAVENVDMLFFGPGDYSVLAGIPGRVEHDLVLKAAERVANAARRENKQFGTLCFGTEHAQRMLAMGATFIAYGADVVFLRRAFEALRSQFAPLGFSFGPDND